MSGYQRERCSISAAPQDLGVLWFPDTISLPTVHERALHYSNRYVIVVTFIGHE